MKGMATVLLYGDGEEYSPTPNKRRILHVLNTIADWFSKTEKKLIKNQDSGYI